MRKDRRATIERADTEAIQIKGQQEQEKGDNKVSGCQRLYKSKSMHREENGDNKESTYQRLFRSSAHRGRRRATIKRADTEAIQNQGPAHGGKGRQYRERAQ